MSVLRPACLSDVIAGMKRPTYSIVVSTITIGGQCTRYNFADLERLYDAEWKKRGFERSP